MKRRHHLFLICICDAFSCGHGCLPALFWSNVQVSQCVCVSGVCVYLLLVFPLQVQSGLNVSSRLLKGLSLGDLSRIVGADSDHVSAQKNHHVGTDLKTHTHTPRHKGSKYTRVLSQEYSKLWLTWVRSLSKIDNILCKRSDSKVENSLKVWGAIRFNLVGGDGCSVRGHFHHFVFCEAEKKKHQDGSFKLPVHKVSVTPDCIRWMLMFSSSYVLLQFICNQNTFAYIMWF